MNRPIAMFAKSTITSFFFLWTGTINAQITLESPLGGWSYSDSTSTSYMQDVTYPANSVNAGRARFDDGGQVMESSIRGRIANTPKQKDQTPNLLVVNGVPLPLRTDEGGYFSRPYIFLPGPNSVEVSSAGRQYKRRVNFFNANPSQHHVGLRIVLSWDTDLTDLDLHVISPDGEHIYYGERVGKNGGALDVDVTSGYGPEIYAIPSPPPGNWQVYANYYGGGWSDNESSDDEETANGDGEDTSNDDENTDNEDVDNDATEHVSSDNARDKILTIAQVAIIKNEGTINETQQIFRVPMRRPGELTLIRSFMIP